MSAVDLATKHGATFERQANGNWLAICRKRGRPLPLVQFLAETQESAAKMYIDYFHIREQKR